MGINGFNGLYKNMNIMYGNIELVGYNISNGNSTWAINLKCNIS